jgi:hypothetical protein
MDRVRQRIPILTRLPTYGLINSERKLIWTRLAHLPSMGRDKAPTAGPTAGRGRGAGEDNAVEHCPSPSLHCEIVDICIGIHHDGYQ